MLESYLTIATHPLLWIFIGLTVVFYGVQWLVGQSADAPTAPDDRIRRLAKKVGLKALHPVLFLILLLTWGIVAGTLFAGLYAILWQVIFHAPPEGREDVWNWRFTLAQLVALTTVLGALIALPITINRLILTRRQTDTVEQGHITDRINKAVEGLGAEKQVNRLGRNRTYINGLVRETEFEWRDTDFALPDGAVIPKQIEEQPVEKWENVTLTQPNLEVRIGAIYALERIAQDSDRDHVQIMEILCAYIRQNAPVNTAQPFEIDSLNHTPEVYKYLPGGSKPRVDIQAAVSVIGRRKTEQVALELSRGYRLDLRGVNFQNVDFGCGNWRKAIFDLSILDQANLENAKLENASFKYCRFENAFFKKTALGDVSANGAQFRYIKVWPKEENVAVLTDVDPMGLMFDRCTFGEIIIDLQFHTAILTSSTFNRCQFTHAWFFKSVGSTNLGSCRFNRCSIRNCRFKPDDRIDVNLDEFFGDGSVKIATDQRPSFWPSHELSEAKFEEEWRKWQADPDNYTPPEAPEEE